MSYNVNDLFVARNSRAAAAGGYEIERSVRFNSADTAYLNRTPSSGGNRKTWTWAGWVKRSALGAYTPLFTGTVSSAEYAQLDFKNTDQIRFADVIGAGNVGGIFETSGVYRDVGAWYHVVAAFDSTQATAADRFKLYVNGAQAEGTQTNAFQSNFNGQINNTIEHRIGRWHSTTSYYSDFYLADVHFIDGQALDATSFGEFDDNGIWQPIEYGGSYGTATPSTFPLAITALPPHWATTPVATTTTGPLITSALLLVQATTAS
jgi:hypothetical protein